jgi:hypothetical protein
MKLRSLHSRDASIHNIEKPVASTRRVLSFTTDGQRCVELQRRICLRRSRIFSISQNAQTKQAPRQAAISKNRKALLAFVIALMDIALQQACHEVRAIKRGAGSGPRPSSYKGRFDEFSYACVNCDTQRCRESTYSVTSSLDWHPSRMAGSFFRITALRSQGWPVLRWRRSVGPSQPANSGLTSGLPRVAAGIARKRPPTEAALRCWAGL